MLRRSDPAAWVPSGVEGLEPTVEEAVRSVRHALVVAGPGAGKTELLAQRACYLLQTRTCPRPHQILALSYKRDAAANLKARVRERCGEALARQFRSMTYDAFAKEVVDRFGQALPAEWRPDYDYRLEREINQKRFADFVRAVPDEFGGLSSGEAAQVRFGEVYKKLFVGRPLSTYPAAPADLDWRAAISTWRFLLQVRRPPIANFHMLARLAAHVFATNPKILSALRASYRYVFLDEFQDTTALHYDLIATAFHGSQAVLTAVGDQKQSIMRWALALEGVFLRFAEDFSATVYRPRMNYRAAPALVGVVGHLAAAIDPEAISPEAFDDGSQGAGECRVLRFKTGAAEAEALSSMIARWVREDKLHPRDICVLTRQTPGRYAGDLIQRLGATGVPARVESEMQDLLAEPVTTLLLDFIKLAVRSRVPESWCRLSTLMLAINGDPPSGKAKAVCAATAAFIRTLSDLIGTAEPGRACVADLVKKILEDFITLHKFLAHFTQYRQGTYLIDQLKIFVGELSRCLAILPWGEAIDRFEGKDSVPVMTIHKSKGLEYHTVIFIGLEDYVFRDFKGIENDEETCAFFVALSRAKKRVLFTFSKERQGRSQSDKTIRPLYDLLEQAGVHSEDSPSE